MKVTKVSISKSDLQGHSKALAMVPFVGHTRFTVSLPLQLCLFIAPLTRYYRLFPHI